MCFLDSISFSHSLFKKVEILNCKWDSSNAFAKISGNNHITFIMMSVCPDYP